MKTSSLDYKLPPELIATYPVTPRDSARLMVVNRKRRSIEESTFKKINDYLKKGDVLVFNQSKVFPARVKAKTENGREVEILLLNEVEPGTWEILVGGRAKDGGVLDLGHGLKGGLTKGDSLHLNLGISKIKVYEFLERHGTVPLPPYIKREAERRDKDDYQNFFATETGSAASPTAGLHFTPELVEALKKDGVQIEYVTLHVGLGTFAPIKTKKIEEHQIHTEYFEIDAQTKRRILKAKAEGRRIIACGTTSLRVLESLDESKGAERGETQIYIYPGYRFKIVDGLVTNFHTPRSSLLALVWAFGGKRLMKRAYQKAIKQKYRFFSYGDGMFIS